MWQIAVVKRDYFGVMRVILICVKPQRTLHINYVPTTACPQVFYTPSVVLPIQF